MTSPPTKPSWQQRAKDLMTSPEGRVGAVAGVGGIVLGLVLGLCVGGGDGDATATDGDIVSASTTLPPLGGAFDSTTTTVAADDDSGEDGDAGGSPPALDRNPLSGEPLASPATERVIAVKLDNVPPALPQVGIGEADMIIEVPVEGGETRFLALYYDARPSEVGSVRSIRPVDADLLAPLSPVLMSTGGRDFVERLFPAAGVTMVPIEAEDAYRPLNRPPPHDIFAVLEGIERFAGDTTTDEGLFTFGDGFEADRNTGSVAIPFSGVMDVVWRFEGGVWVRAQNGETHEIIPTISGSPEPLTTDTIVILLVAQRSAGYVDTAGSDVPTFDVIGFGDAMVLHDGGVVEGRWLRAAQEEPFVLVDSEGAPLTLPPGRVFLEIVPRFVDVSAG